ncbi:hypothetical protein ACWE42_10510 [Sutcliffiella cohnii]
MLEGKTHDLKWKKGDSIFLQIIGVIFFIMGTVAFISSFNLGWLAIFFFGGLGIIFIGLGAILVYNFSRKNYRVYGINQTKNTFWEAECLDGKEKYKILTEIPFENVSTMLLAPVQQSRKTSNGPLSYFLVPAIIIVYHDGKEEKVHVVHFQTDEETNDWLLQVEQLGFSLDVTDEAVNYLMYQMEGARHIKDGIPKRPLDFTGDVTKFINRNKGSLVEYPKYHIEEEKNDYNFNKVVECPINLKKVISWHATILLIIAILDHIIKLWFFNNGTGNPSIVGLLAVLIIYCITFFLVGYGVDHDDTGVYMGFAFSNALLWFLFIDNIVVRIMQLPNLDKQIPIEAFLFIILSFPMMAVIKYVRKKKPAEHHLHIKKKRELMRYKDIG